MTTSKTMTDHQHQRFYQMRRTARRHGKVVPTLEQLENLLTWTNGMVCKDCGCQMRWLRGDDGARQITLQHYRSGSMALVCLSCNTKHAKMPGDTYLELPKGYKRCPVCQQTKPLAAFGKRRSSARDGRWIADTYCAECRNARLRESRAARRTTA